MRKKPFCHVQFADSIANTLCAEAEATVRQSGISDMNTFNHHLRIFSRRQFSRSRITGIRVNLRFVVYTPQAMRFSERVRNNIMPLYDALGWLEKKVAKAQGKGFGSNSIGSEIGCIRRLLGGHSPTLCVDIGGNVGDYSAELHKRFPESRIICFEPSATNIQKLNKRFSEHDNIQVEPIGLAEKPGSVTLYSDVPGSGLGSMTKRDLSHFGREFDEEETINIIRFESYWQQQLNSEAIDIMKMDIEGHELDALTGCGDALDNTRIVQFEFGGTNIDTRTYFRDFWQFFRNRQFDLYRITPMGLHKIKKYRERDEYFRTTNFLACKK